jgi:hypothetical protein
MKLDRLFFLERLERSDNRFGDLSDNILGCSVEHKRKQETKRIKAEKAETQDCRYLTVRRAVKGTG